MQGFRRLRTQDAIKRRPRYADRYLREWAKTSHEAWSVLTVLAIIQCYLAVVPSRKPPHLTAAMPSGRESPDRAMLETGPRHVLVFHSPAWTRLIKLSSSRSRIYPKPNASTCRDLFRSFRAISQASCQTHILDVSHRCSQSAAHLGIVQLKRC